MKIRSKLFVLLVSIILTSLLAASFVSINVLSTDLIRKTKAHLEDDLANSMNKSPWTPLTEFLILHFLEILWMYFQTNMTPI